MKKYKKWLIAGAVLAAVIVVAVVFVNGKPEPVIEPKVAQVRVLAINSAINEEYAKYIGIIQPLELHQATFSTIGTIEAVHVKEGQRVKKGDVLATLETESAQISLSNAQESLEAARHQRAEASALMRAEESAYLDVKRRASS
ncbi:MAG: biotin/lipoyl-binding protein [Firmicutes bacterium]|nr:biotin/lipoyl-binding protein [Bacillota bacterium]